MRRPYGSSRFADGSFADEVSETASNAVPVAQAAPVTTATATGLLPDVSATGRVDRPSLRLLRYEPESGEQSEAPPSVRPHVPAVAVAVDATDTVVVRRRAEQVLRLTFEVLDGRRPVAQLTGHLEPRALRYVRAAVAQRRAAQQPARMTSLHLDQPCPDVAEVAAVYRRGPRARALAARFERVPAAEPDDPRRWRCVMLRLL
jgi:hypothetical protein